MTIRATMMKTKINWKVRKKSRFLAAKEVEKALVEGIWKLVHKSIIIITFIIIIHDQEANRNYEEYLAAIGTGPCSQDMVMRADVKLTIEQVKKLVNDIDISDI